MPKTSRITSLNAISVVNPHPRDGMDSCVHMSLRHAQDMRQDIRTDGCFAVIIKCKRVLSAINIKEDSSNY